MLQAQGGSPEIPGIVRLLYGGITEELLLQWGAMSFLSWVLWRAFRSDGRPPCPGVFYASIVLSAVLFGLGHLPAARALLGVLTPGTVIYVMLGNGAFGLVAGWLFWRRGLEAAVLAHVSAHGLAMIASALL